MRKIAHGRIQKVAIGQHFKGGAGDARGEGAVHVRLDNVKNGAPGSIHGLFHDAMSEAERVLEKRREENTHLAYRRRGYLHVCNGAE